MSRSLRTGKDYVSMRTALAVLLAFLIFCLDYLHSKAEVEVQVSSFQMTWVWITLVVYFLMILLLSQMPNREGKTIARARRIADIVAIFVLNGLLFPWLASSRIDLHLLFLMPIFAELAKIRKPSKNRFALFVLLVCGSGYLAMGPLGWWFAETWPASRELLLSEVFFRDALVVFSQFGVQTFLLLAIGIGVVQLVNRSTFYESVIDNSPEGIIAADRKGKVLKFNRGAQDLLGYTEQEARDRGVFKDKGVLELYQDPDDPRSIIKALRASSSGALEAPRETGLIKKDGDGLLVSLEAYLNHYQGREIGSTGIFRPAKNRIKLIAADLGKGEAIPEKLTEILEAVCCEVFCSAAALVEHSTEEGPTILASSHRYLDSARGLRGLLTHLARRATSDGILGSVELRLEDDGWRLESNCGRIESRELEKVLESMDFSGARKADTPIGSRGVLCIPLAFDQGLNQCLILLDKRGSSQSRRLERAHEEKAMKLGFEIAPILHWSRASKFRDSIQHFADLASSPSVDRALLNTLTEQFSELVGSRIAVARYGKEVDDGRGKVLRAIAAVGFATDESPVGSPLHDLTIGQDIAGRIFQQAMSGGKPIDIIPELKRDLDGSRFWPVVKKHGLVESLACALVLRDKVLGVVSFYFSWRRRFSEGELKDIQLYCHHLAIASKRYLLGVESKRLERQLDAVTLSLGARQELQQNLDIPSLPKMRQDAARGLLRDLLGECLENMNASTGFLVMDLDAPETELLLPSKLSLEHIEERWPSTLPGIGLFPIPDSEGDLIEILPRSDEESGVRTFLESFLIGELGLEPPVVVLRMKSLGVVGALVVDFPGEEYSTEHEDLVRAIGAILEPLWLMSISTDQEVIQELALVTYLAFETNRSFDLAMSALSRLREELDLAVDAQASEGATGKPAQESPERSGPRQAKIERWLGRIENELGAALDLTNAISRFGEGTEVHLEEDVSIYGTIEKAMKVLDHRDASIPVPDFDIAGSRHSGSQFVTCDPEMLETAFRNIFLFMASRDEGGGAYGIRVIVVPSGRDGEISIRVSDNGTPMGEEEKEDLFELFGPTHLESQHRLNIRMPLARHLIELNQGSLEQVECESGNELEIRLPVDPSNLTSGSDDD